MYKKITKNFSTYTLLLLITAFLTMQWSSTHVHLPEQHNHDGSQHQHQAKLHSHNLIDEADTSHSPNQVSHVNVITFDSEYCFHKQQKPNKLSAILISETPQLVGSLLLICYKAPIAINSSLNYSKYSTNNPRAPPQIS